MKSLMLAAGVGRRLFGEDNNELPKALLQFGGKTLLQRNIEILNSLGINELVLVVGHRKEELIEEALKFAPDGFIRWVFNPLFAKSPMYSLWMARDILREGGDILFMDADVLYQATLLEKLLNSNHTNCFTFDRNFEDGDDPVKICIRGGCPVDFGKTISSSCDIIGEWPGFMRMSNAISSKIATRAEQYIGMESVTATYEEAFRDILKAEPAGSFGFVDVTGIPWIEIDFPEDLIQANDVILPKILSFEDTGN